MTSNAFTKLYKLSREDFLTRLLSNPKDYERFCFIKDKLLYSSDPCVFPKRTCVHCDDNTHFTNKCPAYHYIPNREKVIKQHQYSVPSRRNADFKRVETKKRNTKSY